MDKTRRKHVSRLFVTSFAPAVASHHAPTEWCGVSYAAAAVDTLIFVLVGDLFVGNGVERIACNIYKIKLLLHAS